MSPKTCRTSARVWKTEKKRQRNKQGGASLGPGQHFRGRIHCSLEQGAMMQSNARHLSENIQEGKMEGNEGQGPSAPKFAKLPPPSRYISSDYKARARTHTHTHTCAYTTRCACFWAECAQAEA